MYDKSNFIYLKQSIQLYLCDYEILNELFGLVDTILKLFTIRIYIMYLPKTLFLRLEIHTAFIWSQICVKIFISFFLTIFVKTMFVCVCYVFMQCVNHKGAYKTASLEHNDFFNPSLIDNIIKLLHYDCNMNIGMV